MSRARFRYLLGVFLIFFASCGDGLSDSFDSSGKEIVISYSQKRYRQESVGSTTANAKTITRLLDADETTEELIDNLYILLVEAGETANWNDATNTKRYYTNSAIFDDGEWSKIDEKVTLKLSQADAGERDVYLFANIDSDLEEKLDTVKSLVALETIHRSNNNPWSPNLSDATTKSILMSGRTESDSPHDFQSDKTLDFVELIRTVAKIKLNINLSYSQFSTKDVTDYRYNMVNFDKSTYLLENIDKPTLNSESSGWKYFSDGSDRVSTHSKNSSNYIVGLELVTYINETSNAGSYIEIEMPFEGPGFLPPPEFGPETRRISLPDIIERNHYYIYNIKPELHMR